MKYKVRFHLGKGKYHRHFQVTDPHGVREFHDPKLYIIRMKNARLYNNCKVAEMIYAGRNKTVCSWIECEEVEIETRLATLFGDHPISPQALLANPDRVELKYNPRKNPHWLENGKNVDFKCYSRLFTNEDRVFVEAY